MTEEIHPVVGQLVEKLAGFQASRIFVVSHQGSSGVPVVRQVMPPDFARAQPRIHNTPLGLNLKPRLMLRELLEHYLLSVLYGLAYASYETEIQRRLQHLETAIDRIDDQRALLQRKRNLLRQEEITEELEIILLNAGSPLPDGNSGP